MDSMESQRDHWLEIAREKDAQIEKLTKQIHELREELTACQLDRDEARRVGHWTEYVKLRDDLYAARAEILEARRVGRAPNAFWLPQPQPEKP